MNDIRARLARLERIARGGGSVVVVSLRGLSERMRRAKVALRDEPDRPRTREELETVVAHTAPNSLAHKMAERALLYCQTERGD